MLFNIFFKKNNFLIFKWENYLLKINFYCLKIYFDSDCLILKYLIPLNLILKINYLKKKIILEIIFKNQKIKQFLFKNELEIIKIINFFNLKNIFINEI